MYQAHREKLLAQLDIEDAAMIVWTGSAPIRNNDCEYRFRPDSDFWYLTGFDEPDAVLVLLPQAQLRSVLFLRERNPKEEVWTGRRLGTQAAVERLGVDAAYDVEEFWERLPGLLTGVERVVTATGHDEARDTKLFALGAKLRRTVRDGAEVPLEWLEPQPFLHEQRLFKSAAELGLMRKAVAITAEAHGAAMQAAAPGVNEAEIDALLEYTFRRRGSTGAAYNNIVAGGENACILHYIENREPLKDGDLLLIDAGAEWDYYASDVTRTFPVNGRFSEDQRALYEVVLRANRTGIEACRPGVTFLAVHEATTRVLTEGLIGLGIVEGPLDAALEEKRYQPLFMHRTSHWLGLDVHDRGTYYSEGESRELRAGMVLTIEPGVYIASDSEGVDARWLGMGIRIEDDVLITESGHEVLSANIPVSVREVEAACGAPETVRS